MTSPCWRPSLILIAAMAYDKHHNTNTADTGQATSVKNTMTYLGLQNGPSLV
jgi:hypothetical protein